VLSNRVVLVAVSLVLVIPSAARAAPPSPTRDAGTAGFGGEVTQLATNGHRTYVAGSFASVSSPTGGSDALVSADTGRVLDARPYESGHASSTRPVSALTSASLPPVGDLTLANEPATSVR